MNTKSKRMISLLSIMLLSIGLMTMMPIEAEESIQQSYPINSRENWKALSPEMQLLLGEYKGNWAQLSAPKKQRLVINGQRWLSFPADRRDVLWQRFQRWQSMSPNLRQNMQHTYQRFKQLSVKDRQRILKTHNRFQKMTPERQQQMMQRFRDFQQRGGRVMPGGSMPDSMQGMPSSMPDMGNIEMPSAMPSPMNR